MHMEVHHTCVLGQAAGRLRRRTLGDVPVFGFACTVLLLAFAPAGAQTVEEFYRGKTINFIIGYPPAGAPDIYARLVARHLGKYIPGEPTLIARNMFGAGSLIAANHLFN